MLVLGQQRFYALIAQSSGLYSATDVADVLGVSVRKVWNLAATRRLLCFKQRRHWRFPRDQFDGSVLVAGLTVVLQAFSASIDNDTIICFFLTQYEGTGKTPSQLLGQQFAVESLAISA